MTESAGMLSFPPMNREIVRIAAKRVGGVVKLARALGLSDAAVSLWPRVPADRVLEVERLTGVSRYTLRPDVFGSSADAFPPPATQLDEIAS